LKKNSLQLENESSLLERVALYREEYRGSRSVALEEERERRHANGEVYFSGCWVPRAEAGRVVRACERREVTTLVEIIILFAVLIGIAVGWSKLFAVLLLP
jgi:hypothetical protein